MDHDRNPLTAIRRAARAFFRSQLQVQVRGGLRVGLVDDTGAAPAPSREVQAAARARAEFDRILADLAVVLDEEPEIRDTLRHLVFVEQALREQGLPALYKLPLQVLRRAHEQFEGLVTNWSPHGLASLRSKMAVAVVERERRDDDTQADAYQAAPASATPAAPAVPDRSGPGASDADGRKVSLRQS